MPLGLFAIIFVVLFLTVGLFIGLCFAISKSRQNNQIRAMLRTADPVVAERAVQLLRPRTIGNRFSDLLERIGLAGRLDSFLDQAGLEWSSSSLVLTGIAAFLFGLVIGLQFRLPQYRLIFAVLFGLFGGAIPFWVVMRKRSKRLREFEEQFPEALEFLSRSMRAGHAFTVGLEMLVADSPEPLAGIFRRALHDLHLGASLESALRKLVLLVPLVDVRFFVSSVLLQQETGGNLSEILGKLANVIRERFQIKGQVKAAAAHGKVTGLVLVVLPAVVAVLMFVLSPAYIGALLVDPTGRKLLLGSVLGQIVGFLCIRKIIDIKV